MGEAAYDPATMRYGILGGLEVEDGAREIRLGARKQRVLLLRLLLSANEVVSADELLEALWPTRPPSSAPKLLQVYVSQLRRSLGGTALETHAPGYLLRLEDGELDARRFERELGEARSALGGGNPALASSLFTRALSLWRGRALQDVAYESFALAEAQRLEELRLVCVEGRLESELQLGRHDEVLAELESMVREHPLRESLRRLLMLALYRSGRQADALAEYREAARLLRDELGLEPGAELRALESAVLNQDPALAAPPAPPPARSRIPVPPSSLVGRERELEQLSGLVTRGDVRIVTVNGAGGSGKTRVALEAARRLEPAFANGAVVVELAPLRDHSLVVATIGRALEESDSAAEDPVEALARRLHDQDLLLVLDNFEHLVGAAPDLARLVSLAPRLTLLVTSRRVLHVSGEHVFPLQPLTEDDAVRLFVERAGARSPFPEGEASTVRAICRRLDGLPLAIELAAARTATLTPDVLLERLAGGVTALGTGPRDAPARQQTLTDTLAWSTDLLGGAERRVLARFSVFRGGCTLDAAESVTAATDGEIEALVDFSLLQRGSGPAEPRLTMLETVREHADRLLDESGDRISVEKAHAAYFVGLLGRLHLKWPEGEPGLAVVDREIDNLRAVYDRACGRGEDEQALLVATTLFPYWWVRGHFREGRDRIRALLDEGVGDPALQARALHALAGLQWLMGDESSAEASAARGVEIGTGIGDLEPVSHCHTILGILARDRGDHAAAAEHYERSGALAAELGNEDDVLTANENLADLALNAGDLDEARRRWEWAVARLREKGLPEEAQTMPRFGLGSVAFQQRRLDDAQQDFVDAYELATRAGFPHMGALALSGLAAVAAARDDFVEAARLLGRARQQMAGVGGEPRGNEAVMFEFAHAGALEALGPERFAELLEEGRLQSTT